MREGKPSSGAGRVPAPYVDEPRCGLPAGMQQGRNRTGNFGL
jgi:hypothetical protein